MIDVHYYFFILSHKINIQHFPVITSHIAFNIRKKVIFIQFEMDHENRRRVRRRLERVTRQNSAHHEIQNINSTSSDLPNLPLPTMPIPLLQSQLHPFPPYNIPFVFLQNLTQTTYPVPFTQFVQTSATAISNVPSTGFTQIGPSVVLPPGPVPILPSQTIPEGPIGPTFGTNNLTPHRHQALRASTAQRRQYFQDFSVIETGYFDLGDLDYKYQKCQASRFLD